jgi:hypothetical protein
MPDIDFPDPQFTMAQQLSFAQAGSEAKRKTISRDRFLSGIDRVVSLFHCWNLNMLHR